MASEGRVCIGCAEVRQFMRWRAPGLSALLRALLAVQRRKVDPEDLCGAFLVTSAPLLRRRTLWSRRDALALREIGL
jgi:hypothetical protein